MFLKKILLWTVVVSTLSAAIYIQAVYQPHPELNADPEKLSLSSKKRDH